MRQRNDPYGALDEIRATACTKIPPNWSDGDPAPRGIHWTFKDPDEPRRNRLRVSEDVVQVTSAGRTIGRDGEPSDVGDLPWQIPDGASGPGLGDRAHELASPYVRQRLLAALGTLADAEEQERRWSADPLTSGEMLRFDDVVNDVFAAVDGAASLDPMDAIGDTLLDPAEADAVAAVTAAVLDVLSELTGTSSVAAVLAHPRWPRVRSAARASLDVLEPLG